MQPSSQVVYESASVPTWAWVTLPGVCQGVCAQCCEFRVHVFVRLLFDLFERTNVCVALDHERVTVQTSTVLDPFRPICDRFRAFLDKFLRFASVFARRLSTGFQTCLDFRCSLESNVNTLGVCPVRSHCVSMRQVHCKGEV